MPEETSRRGLIKIGVGAVGACYAAGAGYPVYRYLASPSIRARAQGEITSVSLPEKDLPPAGAAAMFFFGARPAMLIHHADGSWGAFDAVCTHLGCTVQFEPQNHRIHCNCHGGTYDMNTGEVISGPPPRPLTAFHVEVKDGSILVSRV